MLLNQLNANTGDLTDLQEKVDNRVKHHIDVRESLLQKKDDQLKGKSMVVSSCAISGFFNSSYY